jgi:predicted CDP-diglyceride synthetase/phosphatidate cytidylyltransferase
MFMLMYTSSLFLMNTHITITNSIPGHGGVADRFDCQVILLPLVYFYMKAFLPELAI